MNRLTVSAGLRFTIQKESYDAYTTPGPSTYLPNRVPVSFPAADVVAWRDIDPRFGAVYDLFGTGKTAVKFSAARAVSRKASTPRIRRIRRWRSPPASPATSPRLNAAGLPDCDLFNPLANGGCGPWLTTGFGESTPQTLHDPETLTGWGVRPWNWEFSTGVQHELMPRVSVDLTYYRRINGGFLVTDNIANVAADFTPLRVAVPTDQPAADVGHTLTRVRHQPGAASGRPFNTTNNTGRSPRTTATRPSTGTASTLRRHGAAVGRRERCSGGVTSGQHDDGQLRGGGRSCRSVRGSTPAGVLPQRDRLAAAVQDDRRSTSCRGGTACQRQLEQPSGHGVQAGVIYTGASSRRRSAARSAAAATGR